MPLKAALAAYFVVILAISCKKDEGDSIDCAGITPTYTADIKPILDASCAKSGCHDAITKANNYDFSAYGTAVPSVGQPIPGGHSAQKRVFGDASGWS